MKPAVLIATAAVGLTCALPGCTSPAPSAGTPTTSASIADSCINPTQIRGQKIVSDQEIQFTMNNGDVWVNRLPRICSGLKLQGGFTWQVRGVQVCSNQETIYVKDDGTPCQLGVFSRVPAPAE